jgi:outer membrane lipoprotein SlyB
MLKRFLIAPFAALLLAGTANADTLQTLTLRERAQSKDQLAAEVVEVQTHRSAASVIAQDALYGGIAGLAIGGAVALLNGGDNWGRDLAIGAGAGLLIGGIFGAVDAAANADRAPVRLNNAYQVMSGSF